jgi:surfeit locus 1 family protein
MTAKARRRLGFAFWSFILFMLVLTGLFAWLGFWQVARLAEKEALIAEVDRQLTQSPYDVPAVDQWGAIDVETYAFHPLTLTGAFRGKDAVLVFTNISEPRGRYGGPGYWLMTPFEPTTGGTVFVNRGFIPQSSATAILGAGAPAGEQTITGIALKPEAASAFTPGPDRTNHIEWIRDPARLATMAGIDGPVFGLTVDLPAGEAGALPQGGETVIEFPNNHFGYALTWFGFALLTPALLAFWVFRQLRPDKT